MTEQRPGVVGVFQGIAFAHAVCHTEKTTAVIVVAYRDGTGSVTLTRDPTRPGTPVTRDPDRPGNPD